MGSIAGNIKNRRRPELSYDFGLVDQTCRPGLDVRSFDPRATLPTRVDLLDPPPFENNFSGVAHTIYEPEHMMMVDTECSILLTSSSGWWTTRQVGAGHRRSAVATLTCHICSHRLAPAVPSAEDIYSTFSHTDSWPWLYQPRGGVGGSLWHA